MNEEMNAQPSLGGAEGSSQEDALNLQDASGADGRRPLNGVQKRISELVSQRKEAEGKFSQAVSVVNQMVEQNRILLEELRASRLPAVKDKSGFSDFDENQLVALHAQFIDKENENYSPQKAALTMQELIRRSRDGVRKDIEMGMEQRNSFAQRHAQVFEEAVSSLGEEGSDFARQGSPQWQMAKVEFDRLKQAALSRGEQPSPELQRAAVMTAYAKWLRSSASRTGQIEAKRQARESLTSGVEAEIDDKVSMRSLLAQGKSTDEAMLKGSNVVKDMIAKLKAGI